MRSLQIFLALECVWCGAVAVGVWHAQNRRPDEEELPLREYDRLMRTAGPFLPFLVFVLRALQQSFVPAGRVPKPNLLSCFAAYGMITLARWSVYFLHRSAELFMKTLDEKSFDHLISDHMVLGASITAIFQLEMGFLLDGLKHKFTDNEDRKFNAVRGVLDVMFFLCAITYAAILFGLTCGDMYYTALYFHPRVQTIMGFLIGSGFHLGAWQWLQHLEWMNR